MFKSYMFKNAISKNSPPKNSPSKRFYLASTFALATTLTLTSFVSTADVVEWAPFTKHDNVALQDLITAADKVNKQFLSKQKGFKKRELIKRSTNEYADIVYWQSLEDAENASSKVEYCAPCIHYFSSMDMQKSATAGAGFAHYEIIKSW